MTILRHARLLLALCAATLMALGAPLVGGRTQPPPSQYTFLEAPEAVYGTSVFGINNRGQIAGIYVASDVNGYLFVYDKGVYAAFDNPPDALGSTPFAINDQGQVVGQYVDSGGDQHGFLYDKGVYTILDHPDAGFPVGTQPTGINNRGQIVGSFADSELRTHGFLYEDGAYTTFDVPGSFVTGLAGINDQSQIVGFYLTFSPGIGVKTYTFVYDKGVYTILAVPGAVNGNYATGINNPGQVVGYYFDSDYVGHGFVYDKGVYTAFDPPRRGERHCPLGHQRPQADHRELQRQRLCGARVLAEPLTWRKAWKYGIREKQRKLCFD